MTAHPGILLLLLLTLAAPSAGRAEPIPLPETDGAYSWLKSQHLRYENAPRLATAKKLMVSGDAAGAEAVLREMLALDPENNLAPVYLSRIATQQNRLTEAASLLDGILARHPDYLDGLAARAALALRLNDNATAMLRFEELLARMPPDFADRTAIERSLAGLYRASGNLSNAVTIARYWASREDSTESLAFLAEGLMEQQQWFEALRVWDRLRTRTTDETAAGEIELNRAEALTRLGRQAEATTALLAARDHLPGRDRRLQINRELARHALQMRNAAAAADYYKACLLESFNDDDAEAYLAALLAAGGWDLARAEAGALLKRPDLSPAIAERARRTQLAAHKELGDHMAAFITASELFASQEKPADLLEAARAAHRMGKPAEALPLYAGYLELEFDPAAAMEFYQLGGAGKDPEGLLRKIQSAPGASPDLRKAASDELARLLLAEP